MSTEHKSNTALDIKDLWQTPKFVFDHYNKRFDFKMDVASSDENKLCELNLTESDDALKSNWSLLGNWCNPLYSDINPWVKKSVHLIDRDSMK